jgi:hypothetical protein
VAPRPQPREQREPRRERRPKSDSSGDSPRQQGRGAVSAPAGDNSEERRADDEEPFDAVEPRVDATFAPTPVPEAAPSSHHSRLVDQLAGREIASRLRGRYAEMTMRIRGADDATRASLMKLAEAMDPDRWDTPEAVLQGVSNADGLFEKLRTALTPSKS